MFTHNGNGTDIWISNPNYLDLDLKSKKSGKGSFQKLIQGKLHPQTRQICLYLNICNGFLVLICWFCFVMSARDKWLSAGPTSQGRC